MQLNTPTGAWFSTNKPKINTGEKATLSTNRSGQARWGKVKKSNRSLSLRLNKTQLQMN